MAREPASRDERRAAKRRAQELLGLFAYHRDAPLVARALGVSLADLTDELDRLKIRRRAFRLARGSDHDTPAAAPVPGAPRTPVMRRRQRRAPEAPPPQAAPEAAVATAVDEQARALKALLAELGPRRAPIANRLGTGGEPLSEAALLARFRAAGLEREFALRERDLIRALWSKHRASESRVASELSTTPEGLRRIAVERGIARDLEAVRDRLRRDALRTRWPAERIALVLDRRDELRELGVLDELEREVRARAGVIWKSLAGKRDGLALLAKKLRLDREDAIRLQSLLDLR